MKKLVVGFLLMPVGLLAKLYVSDSDEQFFKQIARHNLAIVHFNTYPTDEQDIPELNRMKDAFFSLSKSDRYKQADLAFFGVNVVTVPELAHDYNIDVPDWDSLEDNPDAIKDLKPEQQAVVMLFKDGKPVEQDGKAVKRVGFMTKSELKDFIENYFGSALDARLEVVKAARQERIQARPATVVQRVPVATTQRVYYDYDDDYYYRPSYRYYRPYYRGGYYPYRRWYGPGFGVGFGFGGRRGGFGIGFGW